MKARGIGIGNGLDDGQPVAVLSGLSRQASPTGLPRRTPVGDRDGQGYRSELDLEQQLSTAVPDGVGAELAGGQDRVVLLIGHGSGCADVTKPAGGPWGTPVIASVALLQGAWRTQPGRLPCLRKLSEMWT